MKSKIRNFQILRFLAAAFVLFAHISLYIHDRLNSDQYIFNTGKLGVVIFFTLSGTIMQLNFAEKNVKWTDFLKARFIRVIPLYWCALLAKLCIYLFFPSLIIHSKIDTLRILKSIFLIPDKNSDGIQPIHGVAWTLYFEIFFYIIFSLFILEMSIIRKIKLHPKNTGFILETLLLGTASFSIFRSENTYAIYASSYLIFFYAGISLARLSKEGAFAIKKYRMLQYSILCLIIIYYDQTNAIASPGTTILYLAVSMGLIWISMRFPNLSENRLGIYASKLGDASYSLYLFHPLISPIIPVLIGKLSLSYSVVAVFLITFVFTTFVTFTLHRILEIPLLKFLRNLIQ